MTERSNHWQSIYGSKPAIEVSWYQQEPTMSLRLITTFGAGPSGSVIDLGGGQSSLVDVLMSRDWRDVTVLDVSEEALTQVRHRLGEKADRVTFANEDLLAWEPDRTYDVWHDRAVFHFLTEPAERDRYRELAERSIERGGILVLGAFAEDGPTQCSGLPVARYSTQDLADLFEPSFAMIHHEQETHLTPSGAAQRFSWVVLRRR